MMKANNKQLDMMVSARLSGRDADQLTKIANLRGLSRSEFIRRWTRRVIRSYVRATTK